MLNFKMCIKPLRLSFVVGARFMLRVSLFFIAVSTTYFILFDLPFIFRFMMC